MYKPEITTFIHLGTTNFYILQAQRQGSEGKILSMHVRVIDGMKDEEIAQAISQEIKARQISMKHVIGVLDRKHVFFKQLTLPSGSPDELRKMVELQILQYLPNSENISWDFTVLNKEADGQSRVLCLAAYNDAVNRYLKIFSTVHMHPVKLTVSSFGFQNLPLGKAGINPLRATVIILLNVSTIEVCFMQQQRLYFSRYIPYGTRNFQEEKNLILDQIHLTIDSFRKEKLGNSPEQIVVVASGKEGEMIRSSLETVYKVTIQLLMPSVLLSHLERLNVPSDPESAAIPFFGLSSAEPDALPNLLPMHVKDRKKIRHQQAAFYKTLILGGLTAFLALAAVSIQGIKQSAQLKDTELKLVQMKIQVKEADERRRQLKILKDTFIDRVPVIDLIKELYTLTPSEIVYDVVEMTADRRVILEGQTVSAVNVNQLQSALLTSSFFSNVNLEFSTRRATNEGEKTFFRITCIKSKS